jgi:hypothetical protein
MILFISKIFNIYENNQQFLMKYFHTFGSWKKIFEEVDPPQPQKKEVKIGDRFEVKDATNNTTHQIQIVGPKKEDGSYDSTQNFVEAKVDQKGPFKLDKKDGGNFGGFQEEGKEKSGDLMVQRQIELVGGLRSFEKVAKNKKGLKLDYTTLAKEEIWQGQNYNKTWKPAVKKALDNPDNFKSILKYLKEYNGQDADTVKKIIAKAEQKEQQAPGSLRKELERLATDGKIGPFHAIIRDVIESVTKQEITVTPSSSPAAGGTQSVETSTSGTQSTVATTSSVPKKKSRKYAGYDSERRGEIGTKLGGKGDWTFANR